MEKYENISDSMELEIANYLNQVSEGRLSSESKLQIRAMLREVTEIESIGDSCYNLARTINRKRQTNQDFTEKQYEHIHFMMKLTDDALEQMIVVVEHPEHAGADVNKSFNLENEINNYRNQLKNQNILDVNNKEYDYQMGVYYMDIIAECEKLGDYVVNVVEASSDIKKRKRLRTLSQILLCLLRTRGKPNLREGLRKMFPVLFHFQGRPIQGHRHNRIQCKCTFP